MVSRVACLEITWAKSFGFSENSGQGAISHRALIMGLAGRSSVFRVSAGTTDSKSAVHDGRKTTNRTGDDNSDDGIYPFFESRHHNR